MRPCLTRADEGEAVWFLGSLMTTKAAGAQTGGRLTVVEFLDELFYVLSGGAEFHCDGERFTAGPGDFVLLPAGLPHTFVVDAAEPMRALQITTPSGFEDFAAAVGEPARARVLPAPPVIDPAALGHAAAVHSIELLGPPPVA